MNDAPALQDWISHIFDHPVSDPAWYWSEYAQEWQGGHEQIPSLIAETFERGGELLARFSDEQLDQGFWFLVDSTPPEFVLTLVDEQMPLATQLRALRSFVPLFEQVMAARCTPHLSHLGEPRAGPLNGACYMWWDLLHFSLWDRYSERNNTKKRECAALHAEIVAILRRLLAIPHDACRESALHGIGHLCRDCPQCRKPLGDIIDEFRASAPGLRPELAAYAERARVGKVQ